MFYRKLLARISCHQIIHLQCFPPSRWVGLLLGCILGVPFVYLVFFENLSYGGNCQLISNQGMKKEENMDGRKVGIPCALHLQ